MVKVNFYEIGEEEDCRLSFAVILAQYKGKWIYVKHKERKTWETPGGHRESGEKIEEAASRELYEETGAKEFNLQPICIYSVNRNGDESFGQIFYAKVDRLEELPEYEINKVEFFDSLPEDLTYPMIQPSLYRKGVEFIENYK